MNEMGKTSGLKINSNLNLVVAKATTFSVFQETIISLCLCKSFFLQSQFQVNIFLV